ncbi:MAG: cell division protein ZapA [Chitinophagaceae bacterium]|nr:MAG: cell division protein ZapA [Chitinophagaceae bacterium]
MADLIAATVVIADRSYRIKLDPKDEETVRRTVKTINDKVVEYKTAFAGKDMQDYIAMVLIWLATEQQKQVNSLDQELMVGKLEELERMLDGGSGQQ